MAQGPGIFSERSSMDKSRDLASWFLLGLAAILACIIIGSQVGIWLGNAICALAH